MKKLLLLSVGVLAIVAVAVVLHFRTPPWAKTSYFDTPYQAVLLDNGQFFYCKIKNVDTEFATLEDMYYVERQVDPATKAASNILVRRGNEWHRPNRAIISKRHIVMIEPVSPGSQAAQLINQLESQAK